MTYPIRQLSKSQWIRVDYPHTLANLFNKISHRIKVVFGTKKPCQISTLTRRSNFIFLWLWVRWVGMFFKPRRANEKRKINEVVLSFRKFALRGFTRLGFCMKWETTKRALSLLKTGLILLEVILMIWYFGFHFTSAFLGKCELTTWKSPSQFVLRS